MTEYEIKPKGKLSLNLKELWDYKELFYFFSWRDIKVKYKQTFLGFAWAIIQPGLIMLVFTFVFGEMISKNSGLSVPYPVFIFTGLIFWNIFASGIQNAGNSMVVNANIIKKIYFPRLIIPASAILVAIFDFLITLLLFAGLLLYYKVVPSAIGLLLYFPLAFIITVLTTFGAGVLLAALNVKYRDFRYVLPFLVQFLMFVTPVIYPVKIVKNEFLKIILSLNPMSVALDMARLMFEERPPDLISYYPGLLFCTILFLAGIYYFRKTESYFADLA